MSNTSLYAEDKEIRQLLDQAYQSNEIPHELDRILGSCNVPQEMQADLAFSRCRNDRERAEVTLLLRNLLATSAQDEKTGLVKPQLTPYFNMPYQYPAVEFRARFIERIASIASSDSPMWNIISPSLEWIFENEKSVKNRDMAMDLLKQMKGKQAELMRLKWQPRVAILDVIAAKEAAFKAAQEKLAWEAYRDAADAYQKGDWHKAQLLFQRIVDHFPESQFYKTAQDLAKQLTEDIKNPPLALPTYAQWNAQARNLSVVEQSQILVSYFGRMKSQRNYWKDPIPEDQSQLINPPTLVYKLGLDAIPALVKELINGRYFPQVSTPLHGFEHYRGIWRVCDSSSGILNELIHFNKPIECLADAPPDEQTATINRILKWYHDNRSLSETQRLLKLVESSSTWYGADHNAWRLVDLNAKEAAPIFLKFLALPSTNEFNRSDILRCCWRLGAKEALPQAQKLTDDLHPQISIYAGMIVYLYGDKQQGLAAIKQALLNGNRSTLSPYSAVDAVSVLLGSGGDQEFQIARQVFKRDYFIGAFSTDVQPLLEVFNKFRPGDLRSILIDQLNDCHDLERWWDANGHQIRQCDQWARFLSEGIMKPVGFSFDQLSSVEKRNKAIDQLKEYLKAKK